MSPIGPETLIRESIMDCCLKCPNRSVKMGKRWGMVHCPVVKMWTRTNPTCRYCIDAMHPENFEEVLEEEKNKLRVKA